MQDVTYNGIDVIAEDIYKLKDVKINNEIYTNAKNKTYTCKECGNPSHFVENGKESFFAHYAIKMLSEESKQKQEKCSRYIGSLDIVGYNSKIEINEKIMDIQNILNQNNIDGYTVVNYEPINNINKLVIENPNNNFIVVDKNPFIREHFYEENNTIKYIERKIEFSNKDVIFKKKTVVKNIFFNDKLTIGVYLKTDGFYILKRYQDNYVIPYKITLNDLTYLNELLGSDPSKLKTYDNKIEEYKYKVSEFNNKIEEYKNILNNGKSFNSEDILNKDEIILENQYNEDEIILKKQWDEDEIILENQYNEELNKILLMRTKTFIIKFDWNKHGNIITDIIKKYIPEEHPIIEYSKFDEIIEIYEKYDTRINMVLRMMLRGKTGIWNNKKYNVKILTLVHHDGTNPSNVEIPSILKYNGENDVFYDELIKQCNECNFIELKDKISFEYLKLKDEIKCKYSKLKDEIKCKYSKLKDEIKNRTQELYKKAIEKKIIEEKNKLEEYEHVNKRNNLEREIIKMSDVEKEYRMNLNQYNTF